MMTRFIMKSSITEGTYGVWMVVDGELYHGKSDMEDKTTLLFPLSLVLFLDEHASV